MRHPQGFRIFDLPIRDQEVDGSNPFAPTILLESIVYITPKCEERLVAGQEVELQIHQTEHCFPPQFNALRRFLNCEFYFT